MNKLLIGLLILAGVMITTSCYKKSQIVETLADDPPNIMFADESTEEITDHTAQENPTHTQTTKLSDVGVVLFDFNSDQVKTDKAKGILLMAKGQCEIIGHTCIIGTEEYNFDLGMRRAGKLMEWLESHGARATFKIDSKGESEPVGNGLLWKDRRAVVRCR